MWIRVETFEPDSTSPTSTLNFWTERLREKGDDTLIKVGRKEGEVTFPTDKSVSRRHCTIKCLSEGRNDLEQQAITANSLFECALVVDNEGKAGTFVAELPEVFPADVNEKIDGNNNNDDDDDATDDEDMISQRQSQKSQLASLGAGRAVDELPKSACTRKFWGKQVQNIQMVKVDVKESRVLDFKEPKSIVLQVGLAGSTIKVTWIPFRVTFSRLSEESLTLKAKLPSIGAVEDEIISENTTHLVTSKASVSAKPLIAVCQNIPIITPDFLSALMAHEDPRASLPSMDNYNAVLDDNLKKLVNNGANPKLMRGYTVFILDSIKGALEDLSLLIKFSGALCVSLSELRNEKERLAAVRKEVEANPGRRFLVTFSKKRLFNKIVNDENIYGFNGIKEWAKAICKQNPQEIKDSNGSTIPIPPMHTNDTIVAHEEEKLELLNKKDIANSESDTDDELPPSMTGKAKFQTQQETLNETRSDTSDNGHEVASSNRKRSQLEPTETRMESSMTELDLPTRKRRKREEVKNNGESRRQAEAEAEVRTPNLMLQQQKQESRKSTRNEDFDVNEDTQEEENKNDSTPVLKDVEESRTSTASSLPSDSKHCSLRGDDGNGWFTVAPKDIATRKAWRNTASKRYAENEGDFFLPPAASIKTAVVVSPTTATKEQRYSIPGRRRHVDGPNFKRFRKNIVPRKIDSTEQIKLIVHKAREDQLQMELEENQRLVEEETRRADELFHDIQAAQPRRRRRA